MPRILRRIAAAHLVAWSNTFYLLSAEANRRPKRARDAPTPTRPSLDAWRDSNGRRNS